MLSRRIISLGQTAISLNGRSAKILLGDALICNHALSRILLSLNHLCPLNFFRLVRSLLRLLICLIGFLQVGFVVCCYSAKITCLTLME
uniref:Uncharacterized protein n=1 Tax=Tetranychus urticae TaxID=32264 RepID=T1JV88_TETUR